MVLNTFDQRPFARGPARNRVAVREHAEKLVEQFDVRTPSVTTDAGTLSGGNQQKVIIAREFTHAQKLLIAAQPTRGLDVGSIQYIHRRIVEERDSGAAVLIVSTELDEVLALADRIAVMCRRPVRRCPAPGRGRPRRIGLMMAGTSIDDLPPLEDDAVTPGSPRVGWRDRHPSTRPHRPGRRSSHPTAARAWARSPPSRSRRSHSSRRSSSAPCSSSSPTPTASTPGPGSSTTRSARSSARGTRCTRPTRRSSSARSGASAPSPRP